MGVVAHNHSIEMVVWITAQGKGSMIQSRDADGWMPLYECVYKRGEGTVAAAKWLIEHGADVSAETNDNNNIFCGACYSMPTEFIKYLRPLVPPEHLTKATEKGTPMMSAFQSQMLPTLQHLILIGMPVRPQDFSEAYPKVTNFRPIRARLLAWLDAEHCTRKNFTALILGCRVHNSRDLPPAQRSLLIKLRGSNTTDVRVKLADYLGVRVKAEAARIAAARAVVVAL